MFCEVWPSFFRRSRNVRASLLGGTLPSTPILGSSTAFFTNIGTFPDFFSELKLDLFFESGFSFFEVDL